MTDDDRALLQSVLGEVRALRADLAARRATGGRRSDGGAVADAVPLVAAIVASARDRVFNAAELTEHAKLSADLAVVLADAGANTARRLGKALHRLAGRDIGGWRIDRVGSDRAGALWKCFASVSLETRKLADPMAARSRADVRTKARSTRRGPR